MGNSRFNIRLPLYLGIAISLGILIGAFISRYSFNDPVKEDFNKLKEVIYYVDQNYVDTIQTGELVDYAINKLLEKLDPHTSYISSVDRKLADAQLESNFDGIGVEFSIIKDTIVVITPIVGGPSEKEGIVAGDKIIKINGESAIAYDNLKVFNTLRGKRGTEVNLTILRGKEETSYRIVRDEIPSITVHGYVTEQNIGYLKVTRFASNTYEEFKTYLEKFIDQSIHGLIIDLRDNPGGYLNSAVKMIDELLEDDQLIVYTQGKKQKFNNEYHSTAKGSYQKGKLIVLINEGSASASEIMAGALQDNDRATIIGRRSFGKGLVQMPMDLSDGSELKLTISRYYTPSGRSIQKPYTDRSFKNLEEYYQIANSELYSADSIHFADSLKFKTKNGRTVYGGGGIMPDYFVPLDSSRNWSYINRLSNANVIRDFVFRYANQNKTMWKERGFEDFKKSKILSRNDMNELIENGKKLNIFISEDHISSEEELMEYLTKAMIAKTIWSYSEYYEMINTIDPIYQKAMRFF